MRRHKPELSPEERGARSVDAQAIRLAATQALARREYSLADLRRKLTDKGFKAEAVGSVLEALAAKGLVSNARFTSSFVSYHAARGQGPARIRAELRTKGVSDAEIADALASADADWTEIARAVRRKRFGVSAPQAPRERAKQARFLQYRGFSADQVRAALAEGGEDVHLELDAE
jgi:regulatory protein